MNPNELRAKELDVRIPEGDRLTRNRNCRICGSKHRGRCKLYSAVSTRGVMRIMPDMEFQQFRNPDDRERLNEVRALAQEQIAEDTEESGAERYGRSGRVYRPGYIRGDQKGIWEPRTERDRMLQAGLGPLLDLALDSEQRVLVRLVYDAQKGQRDIAKMYGVTQPAIAQRLATIHKKLKKALLDAFVKKDEEAQV